MTTKSDFADLTSSADVVDRWRDSGRGFEAAGVTSFVAERGAGEAVLCLHGVPTSAFLYRKVLTELAGARDARRRVRSSGAGLGGAP